MKGPAVFLHSLFRTGSTYIWKKFRDRPEFCCYYEPFHENLARLDGTYFKEFNAYGKVTLINRHPEIRKPYFQEYKKFLHSGEKGVPWYKKTFPYDEFCRCGSNPDLLKYINFLIDGAEGAATFFKFTRSAMRVSWFKRNYPVSVNIYLYRNPRDQWQSSVQHMTNNSNPYFLVRDIMIAGKNAGTRPFAELAGRLPLYNYTHDDWKREEHFYQLLLNSYSIEERYAIFYYVWLMALVENMRHADYILDIDDLCAHADRRDEFNRFLGEHNLGTINFSDATIMSYSRYALDIASMRRIELGVQEWMSDSIEQKIKARLASLKNDKIVIAGSDARRSRKQAVKKAAASHPVDGRVRDVIVSITAGAVDMLEEKERFLDGIYKGYTYRLGDLLLSPMKGIKMTFNKLRNTYKPGTGGGNTVPDA